MKMVLLIFFVSGHLAFAKLPAMPFNVNLCLASAYAAEKAILIEDHYYTDKIEALNLDKNCEDLIKRIVLPSNDQFVIYGGSQDKDKQDNQDTWSINEKKELRQFK